MDGCEFGGIDAGVFVGGIAIEGIPDGGPDDAEAAEDEEGARQP